MRYGPLTERATGRVLLLEARSQLARSGALAEIAAIDRALPA
jgi:hypothetical protein